MNRLDEARTYNLQAAEANPNDPDILYLQGVLDWEAAYKLRMESRSRLALTPLQPLPSGQACAAIRAANHVKVDQGIADLSKAIKLRPDFGDAMAYLNLVYRERADYECDNAAARAADLRSADEWVDKTMATKKATLEKVGGGNAASLFPSVPTSPPPPPSAASAPQRVQVSQGLSQGLLLTQVSPAYPPLARQARIQGTVVVRAVISKDGSIESLTLVSGHPMLVPAAMDAVKQWKYKPYFLKGEPVEVETTINVNFTLAGG